MAGVTMNIIFRTMFDAEIESDLREIKEAVVAALEIVDERFNDLIPIPDWLPTRRNLRIRQAVATLDALSSISWMSVGLLVRTRAICCQC